MAPIPAVDRAIRIAAIEFCKTSEAIRETLSSVTVVAGQSTATLGISSLVRANALKEARYLGEDLALTSPRDLGNNMPRWDIDVGTPEYIFLSYGDAVTLAPVPETTDATGLKVTVSVEPAYNATKLPEELADAHFQAIVDGAVGNLLEMKGSDWGDTVLAPYYKGRAEAASEEAKSKADHNSTRRRRGIKYGGY
jgi:hypothetical protein